MTSVPFQLSGRFWFSWSGSAHHQLLSQYSIVDPYSGCQSLQPSCYYIIVGSSASELGYGWGYWLSQVGGQSPGIKDFFVLTSFINYLQSVRDSPWRRVKSAGVFTCEWGSSLTGPFFTNAGLLDMLLSISSLSSSSSKASSSVSSWLCSTSVLMILIRHNPLLLNAQNISRLT